MAQDLTRQSTFGPQNSASKQEGTFLEQFGVDPRTQQQILQQMADQRLQDAMAANDGTQERFAGDHALQDSGAALASMLANKFNKPQLTPEQQRGADAKTSADKQIALLRKAGQLDDENGELDGVLQSNEYQRILSGELLKAGDSRGVDMARELQKQLQEQEVYRESRVSAGLDQENTRINNTAGRVGIQRSRIAIKQAQFDLDQGEFIAKRGELAAVWLDGTTDQAASIMGYISEFDGSLLTQDKDNNFYSIPMGQYTTIEPEDPNAKGRDKAWDPTPTEQKDVRAAQRSIMTQVRLADVMMDSLGKAIDENGALNILDGAGKFNAFAVNLANNVNAVVRQGEQWVGITLSDGDPKDPNSKIVGRMDGSIASTMAYVKDHEEYVSQVVPIPDDVRKGSIQAQRYQAAVVQMAYAKARSNEPGARQLSDADFKNAIKQIGAAATDPEALRQILLDNVQGAGSDFEFWKNQIGEERYNKIIAKPARDEYDAVRSSFEKRFAETFGTPEDPQGEIAAPVESVEGREVETPEQRKARILDQ